MAKTSILMKMGLDTSKVKAGLDDAQKNIKDFAAKASDKLASITKIGIGAIVGGFAAASRSAIEYAREIDNLSNLANSSGEEFQKMSYAARTVGIEQEKLADIYKDFSERVGQFLRGDGGEMAPFFEGVGKSAGVTAEQMQKLSGPQGMGLYIKTLMDAGVPHKELISYMEDVASDASALIPLYQDNAKELRLLTDEVERLGLIMDDPTIKRLKEAEAELEKLKIQAKIAAAETLMGFQVLGGGAKQLGKDWKSNLGGIVKVLLGDVKGGLNQLSMGFDKASVASDKAFNEIYGDAEQLQGTLGLVVQDITSDWIEGTIEQTNAYSRDNKKREEIAKKLQKELEEAAKITAKAAEEREKRALAAMTSEEKLYAIQQKILQIRKEIDEIDPFKDGAAKEIAAKKLEIEKLITEEQKTQVEVGEDAKAAQQAMREEAMKELELRRLSAEAAGDAGLASQLERQIERQSMINELVEQYGKNEQEAARIVDALIAKKDKQKDLELQVLKAQADGNDALAAQLQMRIDKEQEALDIMNEFGVSIEEATALAAKLAAMRAGPDLNQSGIVTKREQAQWDEMQRDKAREQNKRIAQEEQDEREIANRWENVSEKRRQTGSPRIRSLEAEDRNLRRRENKEIGEAMRRGGDVDALRADIAARRAKRQQGLELEQQLDQVNRNRDMNIQDRTAERKRLRAEQKRLKDEAEQIAEARRKGGLGAAEELRQKFEDQRRQEKADDLNKQAEEARKAGNDQLADDLKKQAEDVKKKPGDAPDKPKEPKKPDDKMVDALGGKIDTTNAKLEDIKKLLTC